MGTRAVARKYRVSEAWVRRLKQRRRETGRVASIGQRHGPRPGWEPHAEAIGAAVRAAPDLTLDEYRARFALPVSRSALARALAALGDHAAAVRRADELATLNYGPTVDAYNMACVLSLCARLRPTTRSSPRPAGPSKLKTTPPEPFAASATPPPQL
jgi:hypothetical protein